MKRKIVSNVNNVMYKGNINRKFFLYCLKKDIKLIRFIFINLFYFLVSLIITKKDIYKIKKFRYFKSVKDINSTIQNFVKAQKKNDYFKIEANIIIDEIPEVLLAQLFPKNKVIGYKLDEKCNVDIKLFKEEIESLKDVLSIYTNLRYRNFQIDAEKRYYVKNKKMLFLNEKKHIPKVIKDILCVILLSIVITIMSFFFTNSVLDLDFLKSYFEIKLFMMNFLPLFALMLIIYFISKRIHWSFLLVSIITIVLGIANQTKIIYRDDIVKFEDLFLAKEALIMSQRYDIAIKKYTIIFILLILIIFFISRKYLNVIKTKWYKRVLTTIITILIIFIGYNKFYTNEKLYNQLGDKSLINIWIATRQYQIRGLIYPFAYTIRDVIDSKPDNYNASALKEKLTSYEYENIPEDKKVNIIAVMLEAYNDFSKFDAIDFDIDIYEKFHKIQKKSISGNIITTIFGGGTVTTERNFLTGYYSFPSFRKNTNSYVWYFKEQGYRTEAMHPVYGAFYNRSSANINLGFDVYYNYENRYSLVQNGIMWDDHYFLNDIISQYEKAKKDNVPYFNFSVTYQNHGPYNSTYYDDKPYYFKNNGMSDESYNNINEYFKGIYDTNDALYEMISYFEKEEKPTIIILFGDHNPYLGDNTKAYNELGINMDLSTIEGFKNYYETPYVIYGNPRAKELFNKSFIGDGNNISPIFLMNELFDYIGLKGNEYLQYMSELKTTVDVINPYFYKIKGDFIKEDTTKLVNEYEKINYYVSRNYRKQKGALKNEK